MIAQTLFRWLVLSVAVALTAWSLPGVAIEGGVGSLLVVAVLVGLVNVLVHAIVQRLPLDNKLILVAVATLVVNALLIWLAAGLSDRLTVDGFLPAASAAVLLSVFSVAVAHVVQRALAASARRRAPHLDSGAGTTVG
jgi:putative membrane protein